jgi:hypothetical protein
MMYKAKVAVCSDIHTKHSTQSKRHVEFLNVKPWWYGKKPLGFKRLMWHPCDWQVVRVSNIPDSHTVHIVCMI